MKNFIIIGILFITSCVSGVRNPYIDYTQGTIYPTHDKWNEMIYRNNTTVFLEVPDNTENIISYINSYVNDNFSYVSEPGLEDYWKTPGEFIQDNEGDCEDFALFKYYWLKQYNIDSKIIVVWNAIGSTYHAILLVHLNGEKVYLDIWNNQILTREQVPPYYYFEYAISEQGMLNYI